MPAAGEKVPAPEKQKVPGTSDLNVPTKMTMVRVEAAALGGTFFDEGGVSSDGTAHCAGVYDDSFTFYPDTCPGPASTARLHDPGSPFTTWTHESRPRITLRDPGALSLDLLGRAVLRRTG